VRAYPSGSIAWGFLVSECCYHHSMHHWLQRWSRHLSLSLVDLRLGVSVMFAALLVYSASGILLRCNWCNRVPLALTLEVLRCTVGCSIGFKTQKKGQMLGNVSATFVTYQNLAPSTLSGREEHGSKRRYMGSLGELRFIGDW